MIKTKKFIFFSVLFLIINIVAGCGVKTPQFTYVLGTPNGDKNVLPSKTHWVLYVSHTTADVGFRTRNMLYVKSPNSLREFANHAWIAPPSQMMTPLIVGYIDSKNFFEAVVQPPFTGESDFRLDTRLVLLQQEFLRPISEVRCIVLAVLMNNKTGKVMAFRRFEAVVPAAGNNPESGVQAANRAVSQISEQISQFVIAKVR